MYPKEGSLSVFHMCWILLILILKEILLKITIHNDANFKKEEKNSTEKKKRKERKKIRNKLQKKKST